MVLSGSLIIWKRFKEPHSLPGAMREFLCFIVFKRVEFISSKQQYSFCCELKVSFCIFVVLSGYIGRWNVWNMTALCFSVVEIEPRALCFFYYWAASSGKNDFLTNTHCIGVTCFSLAYISCIQWVSLWHCVMSHVFWTCSLLLPSCAPSTPAGHLPCLS